MHVEKHERILKISETVLRLTNEEVKRLRAWAVNQKGVGASEFDGIASEILDALEEGEPLKVGDEVQVVDTSGKNYICVGDIATLIEIDRGDPVRPYLVSRNSDGKTSWVKSVELA